jgi:hypothetical protein
MPVCTIHTDDDSSFELISCGSISDKDATNQSTHKVNEHQENDQPASPLTIGDHQDDHQEDDQSAQELSVDRLVKYEQNQIADINMDIAAIYDRIASLELPDSKSKPESIDHLYEMIARLTTRQVEHIQEIQQRRSASKQTEIASQDVRKQEPERKESDDIQNKNVPDPVVSQIVSQAPVISHDRFGNPLSSRGLPLTLWNPTIQTAGNQSNHPTHPLPTSNGDYHGGGGDDNDGDEYYGGGGCRRRARNPPPNPHHTSCPFDDPMDPGKEGKENAFDVRW